MKPGLIVVAEVAEPSQASLLCLEDPHLPPKAGLVHYGPLLIGGLSFGPESSPLLGQVPHGVLGIQLHGDESPVVLAKEHIRRSVSFGLLKTRRHPCARLRWREQRKTEVDVRVGWQKSQNEFEFQKVCIVAQNVRCKQATVKKALLWKPGFCQKRV